MLLARETWDLVTFLQRVELPPQTSKALEAKHAQVVGQALAGVPLWEPGLESRHPGVPYIVFLKKENTLLEHIFNVYNMEGVEGVVVAAEEECRPVILQDEEFVDETRIDALAVCIGNVHGKYPSSGPNFGLDLLKELQALCSKKGVFLFLVLYGASSLSMELIKINLFILGLLLTGLQVK
ncbi:ketose-bisphosphate aldolase class-II family protein [Melia azedarach]|uniref:Ketose-bisphosphate aldolase class-II family protein n=1 Tax=Melia azedarach TaxID=155640 RepID=A0ACC1YHI5_MELAZ|nr:ketose-bisphosphate aldolase class-II family protein [Melia azedarach]